MYIIVGLGNPGSKYEKTRHNAGFRVIDSLAEKYGIPLDFEKHKAACGKGIIEGEKVLLMKPITFMNNSGEAVRNAMDFYKINPEDELIVIYDDIALAVGRLRIRAKGSAGGHNGIKSIISHTGTQNFKRVRVGVGEKPARMDLADYVLGHFSKEDVPFMEDAFKDAADAVSIIISQDINAAMNKYN